MVVFCLGLLLFAVVIGLCGVGWVLGFYVVGGLPVCLCVVNCAPVWVLFVVSWCCVPAYCGLMFVFCYLWVVTLVCLLIVLVEYFFALLVFIWLGCW